MKKLLSLLLIVFLLSGCSFSADVSGSISFSASENSSSQNSSSSDNTDNGGYISIDQDEAIKMMNELTDYIICDVRTPDEFDVDHIKGAVNVPNESISDKEPELLPKKDQVIFVYCRSGVRSKQASQKLADMGYTRIYEIGGIITWPGETEHSREEQTGYIINGEPIDMICISTNGIIFEVMPEDNPSAEEFMDYIKNSPLTVSLSDYGGFEKVGDLPRSFTTTDEKITTYPGDLILYQGNKITIYYNENTWTFTKLGRIVNYGPDEIRDILGPGDITATFYLK